jgi:putative ATPase
MNPPLAEALRPTELQEILGQGHLLAEKGVVAQSVKNNRPFSMVLFGPPGCGKTTLARAYAKAFQGSFYEISGVSQGTSEIRKVVESIEKTPLFQGRSFLFVDEIHRFTRVQQDFLLPLVERGILTLIGATTENPSFVLSPALLSRLRTLEVKSLNEEALNTLLGRYEEKRGKLSLDQDAKSYLLNLAQGDGRYLLNALELIEGEGRSLNRQELEQVLQKKAPLYDKQGEHHYNLISALHKAVRGCDHEASLYWLERMMRGGEDRHFLLRRLLRMAVEDVGLADPQALRLILDAKATFEALGSPEGDLALYQATLYLALAPKSNRLYLAQKNVQAWCEETDDLPPPKNILNAPTRWMAGQGYGKNYIYEPSTPFETSGQSFLPEGVERISCYEPANRGFEREIKKRIDSLKQERENSR